ncbi:serine hydrolase domain-containing protein [Paracoccus zhejiangensis]|uniref:serine hydrolase domain-containing protein n=1 Tax=Paracoccus zhejiangensis TaxID=1077935 RepID=UPI001E59ACF5|nr:serine hydrolase domain-containing protein [Paracoccus zhejiangensis]
MSDTARSADATLTRDQRIFCCRVTGTDPDRCPGETEKIFPYWSFTKTAIAICALRLVEQGLIDLDTRLPGRRFTLGQLLNHTAGLPDYTGLPRYRQAVANDDEPWSRDDLVTAAMAQGVLFEPGAGWSYSNLGSMFARELIEEVSGRPFSHLVQDLICRPLDLHSVELALTRAQFAQVHWDAARSYHPGWVYHGCLVGTAADAARLLHGLFTGRLLGPRTLNRMLDRVPLGGAIEGRPWTECGYALGLMSGQWDRIGRTIGHSGGGPFSVNAVYHFPDLDDPVTVASFTDGQDEGLAEFAAIGCAGRG